MGHIILHISVTLVATIWAVVGQLNLLHELGEHLLEEDLTYREEFLLFGRPEYSEYDFVVVGSGPTGSVVASRLSERAEWTVLLIEKGLEGNIGNDIPLPNQLTILGPCSKILPVEEEPGACEGLDGGRCQWPTGNCVGGASVINAMIATRGYPSDYNKWWSDGNPGWAYNDIYPYFLRLENMSIDSLRNSEFHGNNGPVHIEYPFQSEIGKIFLRAGEELGYRIIDYNRPGETTGFARTQATEKSGKRHSAVNAYLERAQGRNNFHIIKGALATKIVIDPETRRATGVEYIKNGVRKVVQTRKEVIVSAGAFGSPQLLMLSGIGPRDHLQQIGVAIIQDLPVGNNLQEHLGTPAVTFLINTTDSFTAPKLVASFPLAFLQWIQGNGGVLASNAAEALGYISTRHAVQNVPDVELILLPIQLGFDGGVIRKTLFISDQEYFPTWGPVAFREGFLISPMGMYPHSTGSVRLRSTDPNDPPLINSNFFSDQHDVDVIMEGVRAAIQVASTNAFRRIGARLHDIPVPGCSGYPFNSDEYWNCTIRRLPIQFHHQCGTCRMGPNPESAVVDHRLRVHGVQGLRVADASIMPYIPGIHTVIPCYMIGEKAADMIKEDWSPRSL